VARQGEDVAFLPAGGWRVSAPHDRLAWYVFTDRPLYRPGEDVHFKGWVREIEGGPAGDVALLEDRGVRVAWTAVDSRNNDVAKGTTTLNDLFGFDGVLQLPEDAALGQVRLRFVAEGVRGVAAGAYDHAFQVQEYRRPEYEVSVTHDGGPHFVGGAALITAKATYFAGGGLAESDVDWRVTSATAFFRPPGWDEFAFGTSPRWPWGYDADEEENVQELEGRTDSEGAHYLRVELLEARPPVATTLQAAATIQDVNRQTWTESTNVLVHPAKVYVGLRSERRFVRAGEPLVIEAIAVTPEGEAVAGRPITLRAARTQWSWLRGAWREEELDAQECSVTSEPRAVRCEFETRRGGAYRVTATIEDEAGRKSLTELNVWATGGGGRWRRGEPIELVADRDEYQPGDTAEILVPSPFAAAEGIMTVRREGVAETRRFRADGPSHVLRVPILEEHTPNLHVSVELIAATGTDAAPGALAPDPDRVASGELNLQIPPRSRTLSLSAVPRARELKPGGETIVDLELRDAAGQPVANGDVALAVVDEAVLALLPVELQNPVEAFHPQRDDGATEQRSRDLLLLGPRVDAMATEPGTVRGVIRDGESGGVLSGARVYLEGTEHNVLSGADGSYVLDRVAAGAYTLMVELIGYGDAEERIAVEPGGSQEMDFVLSGQDQYYLTRGMRLEELELAAPMAAMAEGDAARGGAGEAPAIRLRADFAALAVFVASARTDGRGRAQVPVRVPDNLTRYRVIAVAAADARQFGKGESTITAALPLMARPSPPRFLNFGDQLELPVVVQNRSASAVSVDVAVRAANLRFTGARGLRVEVPGEGRVEVRFPATTVQPGA
ncbi:MAG TPA: MG2 domain-containing protein, partial [Gemmatimonadota bacterium]|nr:MG2 domain-containing protein [Gemmatimonadota bacterium]